MNSEPLNKPTFVVLAKRSYIGEDTIQYIESIEYSEFLREIVSIHFTTNKQDSLMLRLPTMSNPVGYDVLGEGSLKLIKLRFPDIEVLNYFK